ncbi:MAG: ATP-binding protein [Bacteroidetes bacterium]|nr:ATP-binding protein [Bacteroidota bacterium]
MNAYELKRFFKVILFLLALLIGSVTLYFSNRLVRKLAVEERKKVALWAEAQKKIVSASEEEAGFFLRILEENTTIPVILESDGLLIPRNLDSLRSLDTAWVRNQMLLFRDQNEPISIRIDENTINRVYYGESLLLRQLRYYPMFALALVAVFTLVSYFAFSYSRKSEQNQVWVGLAKETAHQLGTPITSLAGWIDYLEAELGSLPDDAAAEMRKDIIRLNIITERFSKIGSEPIIRDVDINRALERAISYMETRSGSGVVYEFHPLSKTVFCPLNNNLFDWVIENLSKNSMDAMEGQGRITFTLTEKDKFIALDVSDTGKGIPSNKFKTVFKPGYTSRLRGWGLGLSLAKRIIENYHRGQIFVKESAPGHTTFRILLRKSVQRSG